MCLVIYFVATPVLGFEERPLGKSVWTCEKKHFAGRHHSHSFSAPNLTKIFYGVKGRKRKTWSINWAHSVPLPMWGRAHHCKFDERSQLNNSHNKLHKRKLRERCIFTHLFFTLFFPYSTLGVCSDIRQGEFQRDIFSFSSLSTKIYFSYVWSSVAFEHLQHCLLFDNLTVS